MKDYEKVAWIRKTLNISLQDIADVLGVSKQTISNFEKGQDTNRSTKREILYLFGLYDYKNMNQFANLEKAEKALTQLKEKFDEIFEES